MITVAESHSIHIKCKESGYYSLFNSPYPAHKTHTGIDVYPDLKFGEVSPSPVDGEVIQIRTVKAPTGRGFKDAGHDTVILLKSEESDSIIKILHVDPVIEVGDKLRAGEDLGYLLRSGYYGWATLPHVHLEIRTPDDPLRARGGFQLNTVLEHDIDHLSELVGIVVDSTPEYTLVDLNLKSNGLPGSIGDKPGLLDGGIPYYGWLGIHMENPQEGDIKLLDQPIATVKAVHARASIADCKPFKFMVDGNAVMGLSLYLSPCLRPVVKIIPRKLGGNIYEKGSELKIDLVLG